jgi:glycosyltransferase involved in cell wall biosynthesis
MSSNIVTTIPVYNGEAFILDTLRSLAMQTLRPDRVIVVDGGSKDNTERLVKEFQEIRCEWATENRRQGAFGGMNAALEFAPDGKYFQILHADDWIEPNFYETMVRQLEDCGGFGMAFCLDERIDENNQRLSISGRVNGKITTFSRDDYLKQQSTFGNQAFASTLLKTNYKKAPCQFRLDLPIVADAVFWAEWASHCAEIVKVNLPLGKYRWHGANGTSGWAVKTEFLVNDEWRAMQMMEGFRGRGISPGRRMKLKALLAVRAGIKSKRVRQNGNPQQSQEIARAAKDITGAGLHLAAKILVEARDLAVYKLGGRMRHPKNLYG